MRFVPLLLLLCAGCAASTQSSAPPSANELNRRIETYLRANFNVPPRVDVKMGDRKPSEFPGYDTLPVTLSMGERHTTQEFLISKDNKTLINMSKFDISKDVLAKVTELDTRPYRGNKDAKVVVVNFDDFQCPFCARMHQTLFPGVLATYGNRVKIIYKDFPLESIHPWAVHAAVDANCLAAQSNEAYWQFADNIHGNQQQISGAKGADKPTLATQTANLDSVARETGSRNHLDGGKLDACIKAQDETKVRASMKEADSLGLDSTPTLYINGEKVSGAVPVSDLRMILDRALVAAGEPVPAKSEGITGPDAPPADRETAEAPPAAKPAAKATNGSAKSASKTATSKSSQGKPGATKPKPKAVPKPATPPDTRPPS